jgi:hypothetical protein
MQALLEYESDSSNHTTSANIMQPKVLSEEDLISITDPDPESHSTVSAT